MTGAAHTPETDAYDRIDVREADDAMTGTLVTAFPDGGL